MKKVFWTGIFIVFVAASAGAQSAAPSPTPGRTPIPLVQGPTPATPASTSPIRQNTMPQAAERDPAALRLLIIQKYAQPLYRKPHEKELRELVPDAAVSVRYSGLLGRPDSGIFKLLPDAGCSEDAKVVNSSEQCLKFQFPGAASSFSFRTKSYRIRHLADVTYEQGSFFIPGIHMNGIMVDLGDVPIEQVDLQTSAVKYIVQMQPATEMSMAVAMDKKAQEGIHEDGQVYSRRLPIVADHTYVARSIAYQGRVMKAFHGAEYNELEFDKRRDITSAFRVVKIDPDGAATIVWTQLANSESPKLKTPEKDPK